VQRRVGETIAGPIAALANGTWRAQKPANGENHR
jgi:hypothetical protein